MRRFLPGFYLTRSRGAGAAFRARKTPSSSRAATDEGRSAKSRSLTGTQAVRRGFRLLRARPDLGPCHVPEAAARAISTPSSTSEPGAYPATIDGLSLGPWETARQFLDMSGAGHRGDVFDAFLKSPKFVAEHGKAAATPDLVIGPLGEGQTAGTGLGDQAALRIKAAGLAQMMSKQIGFSDRAAAAGDEGAKKSVAWPSAHSLDDDVDATVRLPAVQNDSIPASSFVRR